MNDEKPRGYNPSPTITTTTTTKKGVGLSFLCNWFQNSKNARPGYQIGMLQTLRDLQEILPAMSRFSRHKSKLQLEFFWDWRFNEVSEVF